MATKKNVEEVPYIILLGDVGTGKSTVVERLTGEFGRSSGASTSVTKTSEVFWSTDGSLIVSDTPGSNAMKDKLEHNVWIAAAIQFMPKVSKVFILVKADTRMDNVCDSIRKYSDRFIELEPNAIGVLVTFMDTVEWSKQELKEAIEEELGFEDVVFTGKNYPASSLLNDIKEVSKNKYDLKADAENFFRLFKINNNQSKILLSTAKEVAAFKDLKDNYEQMRKPFVGQDQTDLVFEFQAFMEQEIIEAQKRMSEDNGFTFMGEKAANEAGHVANMSNQLRVILHDLRIEALAHQKDHGANDLRVCPHCGLKWQKVEGCEGNTTCGALPEEKRNDQSFTQMATYTFKWIRGRAGKKGSFQIIKSGVKDVQAPPAINTTKKPPGCGKTVNWSTMKQVPLPEEFMQGKITTDDVSVLPKAAEKVKKDVGDDITSKRNMMKLKDRP